MRPASIDELAESCAALDRFIEEHHLPTTELLHLENPAEVRRVIDLLTEHGNVATFDGNRPVYYLKPDQALRAAYYRNVVVHHFVPRGVDRIGPGDGRAGCGRQDRGGSLDCGRSDQGSSQVRVLLP